MKKTIIKNNGRRWFFAAAFILVLLPAWLAADAPQIIKLNQPDLKRGLPFMQTLAVRASVREFAEKELSLQDLSDLLWAADGMSRPAENKSTAPSAMNAHDIRIYVFMKDGAFLYDSPKHELLPVLAGDFRAQVMMARPPRPAAPPAPATAAPASPPPPPPPPSNPPVQIVLVSDGDRFTRGDPAQEVGMGRPRRRHRLAEHFAFLRRHRPEDRAQGLDGQGQDQGAAEAGRYPDHLPQPPRRLREIALHVTWLIPAVAIPFRDTVFAAHKNQQKR